MKAKVMKILMFTIKDYVIDIMKEHEDLANTQMALKQKYKSKDLTMVFNLNYKLSILKFQNFISIEEFLKIAQEIENQLITLCKKIPTKTLIKIMLNSLPSSFDSLIYSLTSIDQFQIFEKILSKLILEIHKLQLISNIIDNFGSKAL